MQFDAIFFDLDDTLYPSNTGLWRAIKARMKDYMRDVMGFPEADIPRIREDYFLRYGTTLRGLQANHPINVDEYLTYVHDVPLDRYLIPDSTQRSIIASLPTRKLIFTNADVSHAQRVLAQLRLDDLFDTIVDVNAVAPYCKPMPESFEIAMRAANLTDPSRCAMIDDLPRTTRAAREMGMYSILYGSDVSHPDADACFTDWSVLPKLLG